MLWNTRLKVSMTWNKCRPQLFVDLLSPREWCASKSPTITHLKVQSREVLNNKSLDMLLFGSIYKFKTFKVPIIISWISIRRVSSICISGNLMRSFGITFVSCSAKTSGFVVIFSSRFLSPIIFYKFHDNSIASTLESFCR